MFYITTLAKTLSLFPQNLGVDIKELISDKIRNLEGKVVGDNGYIVSIIEFNQSGKGVVDNETGNVNFKTEYKAIIFKPIKGEILDAVPMFINEHGFFSKVGPLQIFVSQHTMNGDEWSYNAEHNNWTSEKSEIEIGKPVRLEILATRINSDEITALGSLFKH